MIDYSNIIICSRPPVQSKEPIYAPPATVFSISVGAPAPTQREFDIEFLVTDPAAYINPIPSGLVLTGIVVSVSTTALMLALTIRLYERYHSLDLDRILISMKQEEEEQL